MTEVKIVPGNQPVGIGNGPKIWTEWNDTIGLIRVQYGENDYGVNFLRGFTVQWGIDNALGIADALPIEDTPYEIFVRSSDRPCEFWIRERKA